MSDPATEAYLAGFPEDQRETAERAWLDGYLDGQEDQADLEALTAAARAVVDAWPDGDLAGAVRALAELVGGPLRA